MSKQKKTKNISVEALKATLEKKKESNAKALAIVESWIEGVVAEDDLVSNLYFINQEHFQDVIEERAILKICGYPLCGNRLKNIPSKQFHISTQLNKVFDITDRKNFCSNLCYKAAKYLKDQLLTSPLWLRNEKEIIHYKLLSLDRTKGSSGIEVDLGHHDPVKPEPESEEFTSVLNFTTNTLSKLSDKVDKLEEKYEGGVSVSNKIDTDVEESLHTIIESDTPTDVTGENIINLDLNTLHDKLNLRLFEEKRSKRNNEKFEVICNEETQLKDVNCDKKSSNHVENYCNSIVDSNEILIGNVIEETSFEDKNNIGETSGSSVQNQGLLVNESNHTKTQTECVTKTVKTTGKAEKVSKDKSKKKGKVKNTKEIPLMVNVVIRIEHCLREWCTIDTLCFVFGEEKVKEMLRDKGESIKEYQALQSVASNDPHLYERYLMICKKLNVLELEDQKYDADIKVELIGPQKPLPDYSVLKEEAEKMELKVKSFYQGDKAVTFREDTKTKEEEEERPSVLPLVNLHAQKALRRRIVLDKLTRVLSDLGQTLGVKDCYITQDVRLLISTFNLSANNITFKPLEWNLIGLAIFKLLSIKTKLLDHTLKSEISSKNLTLLLLSYQLDGGYLDRLTVWLMDIDYVLRNKP